MLMIKQVTYSDIIIRMVNFFYDVNSDSTVVVMNEKFVKFYNIVQRIMEDVNKKQNNFKVDKADYEIVSMFNTDWIKTTFECDDSFINWWSLCVKNKYYRLFAKLHIAYKEPGLRMQDFEVKEIDGRNHLVHKLMDKFYVLSYRQLWRDFLLFNDGYVAACECRNWDGCGTCCLDPLRKNVIDSYKMTFDSITSLKCHFESVVRELCAVEFAKLQKESNTNYEESIKDIRSVCDRLGEEIDQTNDRIDTVRKGVKNLKISVVYSDSEEEESDREEVE